MLFWIDHCIFEQMLDFLSGFEARIQIYKKEKKSDVFDEGWYNQLLVFLQKVTDPITNKASDNSLWLRTIQNFKILARIQEEDQGSEDNFQTYAALYDAVVGLPCLNDFMKSYLTFFQNHTGKIWNASKVLSVGCGTGLVEEWLIKEFNIPNEHLLGIDISEAMVEVARERIRSRAGDILEIDDIPDQWDIAVSGLNVYQYLPSLKFETAIANTYSILSKGGYFVGDFITSDHIRWYPNVLYSTDKKIISLRTPRVFEREGKTYQESEIINMNFNKGSFEVYYAGKHLRYLPEISTLRKTFENCFEEVKLFDPFTLLPVPHDAKTTNSTRYVVFAGKTTL